MKGIISASIMCVDLANVERDVGLLEQAGIEYIHVDIMDGNFVPNYTFGPDMCETLRRISNIPLDIHLMVQEPARHIEAFKPRPGEYVCVHAEATVHLQRTLALIKSLGARPAVALNPATPITMVEDILPDVEMILLMTVNPGYAGQTLVPQTIDKIARLRRFMDERGFEDVRLQVDGNVSFENALKMKNAGADFYVAGSSSVFKPELGILEGTKQLRESII